ncbi:hypothetical protein FOB22_004229 [Saccharomyces cerevisiae]|nr:hypothetical protein FOB22_004229 [Saccharomyces cerevisiae]
MDLNQRKEKGPACWIAVVQTDLSADTVELIERMDRLAEKQTTASMSIVALPSSFQESNSSDRCRKYCSSDEDSDTCIHGSANASTNATTNSSTNATTLPAPTSGLVLLPLPASTTNATTTASTNSSTNATTTESTNASAKEDANKDGNAEDNRFHPVTDINKESYKRKGSQMVLLERKKLKAQFPNTSENMNVLQFLGFRSDEIKHLFLYGIDILLPRGSVHTIRIMQGLSKDVRALCLLGWPESIVSEDSLGSTSCGENAAK